MTDFLRTSKALVALHVTKTVDGEVYTMGADDVSSLQVSITDPKAPVPGTWQPVIALSDGAIGVMIGPGTSNDFSAELKYPLYRRVFVRVTDNPEVDDEAAGMIRIH